MSWILFINGFIALMLIASSIVPGAFLHRTDAAGDGASTLPWGCFLAIGCRPRVARPIEEYLEFQLRWVVWALIFTAISLPLHLLLAGGRYDDIANFGGIAVGLLVGAIVTNRLPLFIGWLEIVAMRAGCRAEAVLVKPSDVAFVGDETALVKYHAAILVAPGSTYQDDGLLPGLTPNDVYARMKRWAGFAGLLASLPWIRAEAKRLAADAAGMPTPRSLALAAGIPTVTAS